jgi:hypothetical protein
MTINEVQFEVVSATPDLSPLPVLREHAIDVHRIRMTDEGWGAITDPRLTIIAWGAPETDATKIDRAWKGSIANAEPCAEPTSLTEVTPFTINGAPEHDVVVFDLAGRVPRALTGGAFVCAIGQLAFNSSTGPQELAVRTRVSNRPPSAVVAAPALKSFDLYLDPDREDYVAVVPVLRKIAPGATETIPVRIMTDKSSDFELRQSVRIASGDLVPGETFALQIFKARNDLIGYVPPTAEMMPMPQGDISAVDSDGLIESVSFDPGRRQAASFVLTRTLDEAACEDFLASLAPRVLESVGGVPEGGIQSTAPDGSYCDG